MPFYKSKTEHLGQLEYIVVNGQLPGEDQTGEGYSFRMDLPKEADPATDPQGKNFLPEPEPVTGASLFAFALQSFPSDQYEEVDLYRFRKAFARASSGNAFTFFGFTKQKNEHEFEK